MFTNIYRLQKKERRNHSPDAAFGRRKPLRLGGSAEAPLWRETFTHALTAIRSNLFDRYRDLRHSIRGGRIGLIDLIWLIGSQAAADEDAGDAGKRRQIARLFKVKQLAT